MPFLDGKPVIITKRNIDEHGNPISVKRIESKQVADLHNCIPLNYSIDRNHPIYIPGMYQIYNEDEITEKTFFADYDQGLLYFHPAMRGKTIKVTYMSTGYILIASSRIFRYNKTDGSTVTLEGSFEKIENLLEELQKGNVTGDKISAEVIGSRTDAEGQTFPSLGDRLDYIQGQLNNITKVIRYNNVVNVRGTVTTVDVGIPDYQPNTDALSVYLAGVRMIEGVDYTLDKNNKRINCIHNGRWVDGDQIYFEVLKKGADTDIHQFTIYADDVKVRPEILGKNNVQETLQALAGNIRVKSHKRYHRVDGVTVHDININIKEYNPDRGDLLNVYMQGIRMVKDVDYALDTTFKTITNLKGDWIDGDEILFEVINQGDTTTKAVFNDVKKVSYEPISRFIEPKTISDSLVLQADSLLVDTGFEIGYSDKLDVYVNGIRLIDNIDYVLNNNSIISCNGKWKTGDKIYLELTQRDSVVQHGDVVYNNYYDVIDMNEDSSLANLKICDFDITTDKIRVYLNGIRLINEIDYMINSKNKTIICCNEKWKKGDRLYVELEKRGVIK